MTKISAQSRQLFLVKAINNTNRMTVKLTEK